MEVLKHCWWDYNLPLPLEVYHLLYLWVGSFTLEGNSVKEKFLHIKEEIYKNDQSTIPKGKNNPMSLRKECVNNVFIHTMACYQQ